MFSFTIVITIVAGDIDFVQQSCGQQSCDSSRREWIPVVHSIVVLYNLELLIFSYDGMKKNRTLMTNFVERFRKLFRILFKI